MIGIINKENYSSEDIEEIRKWNIDTSHDGIIINNYDEFITKILLTLKLWPQVDNNQINYLFGKGIGVELALQGNVQNRIKYNKCYPTRSHNNIDFYAVSDVSSPNFYQVFGTPTIYPTSNTSVLEALPSNMLYETKEIVSINNHQIYIPELEILFLDKYLNRELIHRKEGYDYELLMHEYDLNVDKILNYLEEYYIKPKLSMTKDRYKIIYDEQIKAIEYIINNSSKLNTAIEEIDSQINIYPKGLGLKYAGIYVDLWIPLSDKCIIKDKDKKYRITDTNYLNRLMKRIELYCLTQDQKYEEIAINIKKILEDNNKSRKKEEISI